MDNLEKIGLVAFIGFIAWLIYRHPKIVPNIYSAPSVAPSYMTYNVATNLEHPYLSGEVLPVNTPPVSTDDCETCMKLIRLKS